MHTSAHFCSKWCIVGYWTGALWNSCNRSIYSDHFVLTHWGWLTDICVTKINIIGSDNGLPPAQRQAIIWTNDGILLNGPLRTNFSEIWIRINTFSFTKIYLKMSSGKCRPYCLGLNVLIYPLNLIKSHPGAWARYLLTQVYDRNTMFIQNSPTSQASTPQKSWSIHPPGTDFTNVFSSQPNLET